MGQLLLGIDIGTTGCKSSLFDISGNLISVSYREYKIISPDIGWAEEDPEEWWKKSVQTVKECIEKSGIDNKSIAGVGISCTNALIPVDQSGKALTNAIMQIDNRTNKEVEWIKERAGEDKIFSVTGNRIAAGTFSAPIILWLKKNMPEIYSRTEKFLVPTGYIVYKLTEKFSIDYTRASTTLLFDIRKREWSQELCRELDISVDKLPEAYPSDMIAGYVTKAAAEATGLLKGTPVAVGIMDTAAAAIGMGAFKANNPYLIMGTVSRVSVGLDKDNFDKRFLNTCFLKNTPYLAMAPTNGGGISMRWFRDNFGEVETLISSNTRLSPYKLFDMEAENIKPGSDGLIYLPYIAGERSPVWDSNAKGVFFGISPSHHKAHFIKAIMEGVAYATRHNVEILENEAGIRFSSIRIGGGGASSRLWRDIIAHVLNKRVLKPKAIETETMGSAVIAGRAVGIFDSYEAMSARLQVESESGPEKEAAGIYTKYFELYKKLYADLKDDFKFLQSILEDIK